MGTQHRMYHFVTNWKPLHNWSNTCQEGTTRAAMEALRKYDISHMHSHTPVGQSTHGAYPTRVSNLWNHSCHAAGYTVKAHDYLFKSAETGNRWVTIPEYRYPYH